MDLPVRFKELIASWGRMQAQQQLMVAAGLRPACRLRIRRERLPLLAETVEQLSLQMVVGNDSIATQKVAGRSGFSEWGQRRALTPKTSGDCYVYLSQTNIQAQRLRRSDEGGDDLVVGSLLGYPSCCVQAFSEQPNGVRNDPVIAFYNDSRTIKWQMNVSLLCFGFALLSHVPCGPDCPSSQAQAESYYDFVNRIAEAEAEQLRQFLLSSVLHTELLGIAAFQASDFENGCKVEKVLAVDSDSILGQLLSHNSFIRREKDGVSVDGHFLTGSQLRWFQFN